MQISLALAADQSHLWYTVVQSIVNAVRPLSKWAGWSGGSPAQPSPAQTSPATRPARAPLCQQHARSWPPRQIAAQLFSLTYGVASTRFVMSASAFTSALRNPKVTEEQAVEEQNVETAQSSGAAAAAGPKAPPAVLPDDAAAHRSHLHPG